VAAQLSSPSALFRPSRPGHLRTLLSPLSFKVFERQRRPRLECLNCDVAAYLAHDWHIEEFVDQKALIVGKIRYDDFKEIICLTGDEVACNNLGHRDNGLLELQRTFIGMPVDLDAEKDREAEPDAVAPQGCPIAFNVPIPFETLDATQTRRR